MIYKVSTNSKYIEYVDAKSTQSIDKKYNTFQVLDLKHDINIIEKRKNSIIFNIKGFFGDYKEFYIHKDGFIGKTSYLEGKRYYHYCIDFDKTSEKIIIEYVKSLI